MARTVKKKKTLSRKERRELAIKQLPAPKSAMEAKFRADNLERGMKPGKAAAAALLATKHPDMKGPGDTVTRQAAALKAFDAKRYRSAEAHKDSRQHMAALQADYNRKNKKRRG
tara:strand:+ start:373 stop:714 length:342 start_codon:yes stop_codon:yes gene_type:complete